MTSASVLSIGQVNGYLKQLIETDDLLSDLWVEGEVTKYFVSNAGHAYLTLTDGQTALEGVVFRQHAARIRGAVQQGDQVIVHGQLTIYEQRSQYQVRVDLIRPRGLGMSALQFELLKQRLEAEGLFDSARKRPIPVGPRVVGVVTSPDAAVWRDIQTAFRRRWPFARLVLSPTLVQGDAAPDSIREALERLDDAGLCDVIIVARGGGSAEDLSAFNDEALARAAFACRTPLISAIGHETDWTLLDLVADLRAATPTAAAELASHDVSKFMRDLVRARERQQTAMGRMLVAHRRDLTRYEERIARRSPRATVRTAGREVAALDVRGRRAMLTAIVRERQSVRTADQRLRRSVAVNLERRALRIAAGDARITALDPLRVLARGFALLTTPEDRRAIVSTAHLVPGRRIGARLHDGELELDIAAIHPFTTNGASR